MALTRNHPLHDLKQTARDLAKFIIDGEQQELIKCLQEAREIYQQPLTSWATGMIYYFLGTRRRTQEIDNAIKELFLFDDDEINKAESVKNLFENGGWEETSFNTTLLRVMVRHLSGYDQSVVLPLPAITELKALLLFEQACLLKEDQISKQQIVINDLKIKKIEMNNELSELARQLREYEARISALKLDEQSGIDAQHQKYQKMLDECQQNIKEIDKNRQEEEEVLAKLKLISLNPNADFTKLSDTQLKEIQRQIQITIDLYFKDIEEKATQRKELSAVVNNHSASAAKSQLAGLSLFRQNEQEERAKALHHEVEVVTSVANGFDKSFKSRLSDLLGGRAVPRQQKPSTNLQGTYRIKQALASVPVINDYTPETAPEKVKEALAGIAISNAVPVAERILPQDKIDSEQFANAKQTLALLFANRQPMARVEEKKPMPSSSNSMVI